MRWPCSPNPRVSISARIPAMVRCVQHGGGGSPPDSENSQTGSRIDCCVDDRRNSQSHFRVGIWLGVGSKDGAQIELVHICIDRNEEVVTALSSEFPRPGMHIDPANTALIITDPQNDFLSEKGVMRGGVGKNVQENRAIENSGTLLKLAKGRVFRFSVHLTITIPQIVGWKFELREDPPARSHSEHVDNRWFLSGVLPGRYIVGSWPKRRGMPRTKRVLVPIKFNPTKEIQSA